MCDTQTKSSELSGEARCSPGKAWSVGTNRGSGGMVGKNRSEHDAPPTLIIKIKITRLVRAVAARLVRDVLNLLQGELVKVALVFGASSKKQ